jgi:hypothetical protein
VPRPCSPTRLIFSCFALLDSFSAVSRASGPVFMFCAPGPVFGGTDGVGSHFHVLSSQSHTQGVGFRIYVLRSRTRCRRYRGRRAFFSCFALPDLCPVFMFCAPGLFFGGTEGVGSPFFVFRSRTRCRRYRGRWVNFSCFALLDSFSAVSRASGPVFIFCAPRPIFGGTDTVGSHFHVLHSRTRFR